MPEIDKDAVTRIIGEIDELLAMRQGFVEAYRDWTQKVGDELKAAIGEELAAEFERKGPRQAPVNRQHRVHIYRQRLHAQQKYLQDLLDGVS